VLVNVPVQGCSTSNIAGLSCHGSSATSTGFSYDPVSGTGVVDPRLHIDGKIYLRPATP